MPEGLIVKALSGYYYVSSLDQNGRYRYPAKLRYNAEHAEFLRKKRLRRLSATGSLTN